MDETASPETGRSRRQKIDKHGRLSALEKLRQLKGSKHKYEVDQLDNVYDEVDERVYSKKVLERQDDDWIVDDDGGGYVEDGREIFDDDLDDNSIKQASKNSESGPRKKRKEEKKSKGSLRNMLMNMPSKKETQMKLEDDTILGDLMSELKNEKTTPKGKSPQVRNKFRTTPKPAVKEIKPEPVTPKSHSSVIQNTSASQKIDESDDEEQLISKSTEKSVKKETTVSKLKTFTCDASVSQEIIDTSDSELEEGKKWGKADSSIKDVSASQNIEDVEDDISQYVGDLSNVDWDNNRPTLQEGNVAVDKDVNPKLAFKDSEPKGDDSAILNQMWDDDFGEQMTELEVSIDSANLPLVTNESGEKVFRFYWWDAFEDPYKQPGVVFLFGKVYVESAKAHVSCCLTVKNIDRRVFLLPRQYRKSKKGQKDSEQQPISLRDVYTEFNAYAGKKGIKTFRSCTVSKYYAFDRPGVPKMSEYLEVKYPTTYPPLEPNFDGETFEHIFGTSVNALELLLVGRKIKGPCWLDVKCPLPAGNPVSWCKIEANCLKMENISVCRDTQSMQPPPLVVATLNIRTTLNAKLQQNEIVMAAVLLHHDYHIDKAPPKPPFQQHFCLVTRPGDTPWPMHARESLSKNVHTEVIRCETERNLLEELLKRIGKSDPDLLVGYDCGFQFDVMMHRMFNLKVPNWSKMGKLKRSLPPVFKGRVIMGQAFCGRPTCDIQNSAKELNLKVRSYDLPSLCVAVLKKKENECKEVKSGDTSKFYTKVEKIEELLRLTLIEASYIITIMFELNVMPLALQITCIAGNILSRTLSAGRAERNEYLLLHAFHDKGYITPDKRSNKKDKDDNTEGSAQPRRKKAAYAGGLVLEPKKGFYDTLILLMDFNSLYPSIIQEYNLCFTTVPGAAYADSKELNVPEPDLEPGVVPTEIRKLVESRVAVKQLMKTPNLSQELKMQYDIRQMALKLTANSMYGCLGATHCRFYAKGLAALVTAKGREILLNTKELVEKLNYQVIYGDTDSIMINTNVLDYDEVFAVGKKIKQEVNKLYRKVELDIDGVFRYLLLLQKKKYAAVTLSKLPNGQLEMAQEHKGLDIVRRDWCQLACDTGRSILDQLLCDQQSDARLEKIFDILQNVSKAVKEGQVPLSSLVITKQLSKNPSDYPDKKQAHVAVAMRLNQQGGRMWKIGDTVPYIICEDGTEKSATERAYHVDEFKKSESLKIDVNYYLMSQIFPVILRICDPIEGIDDALLSEHLGLQGIYKPKRVVHERDDEVPASIDEDRFKHCARFKFVCQNEKCKAEITVEGAFATLPSGSQPVLAMCSNAQCQVAPWEYLPAIQNRLQLAMRAAINEYHAGWMECEDPACTNKTRRLPQQFHGTYPVCDRCKKAVMYRIYSETKLYNQLCFYLHVFDLTQSKHKELVSRISRNVENAYHTLRECVDKQLRRSAYSIINLNELFSNLQPEKQKDTESPSQGNL